MIKPPKLSQGDTIAVIAPSSRSPEKSSIVSGMRLLQSSGYKIVLGNHIFNRHGGFAGSDKERLLDLHDAWSNPQVKAIMVCRGGNGALRLLPYLDYQLFAEQPKIFMGGSDITALHLAISQQTGLVTFHGPSVEAIIRSKYTYDNALKSMTSADAIGMIKEPETFKEFPLPQLAHHIPISDGQAKGKLTGGNLTLIAQTLGTPYEIDTGGKIFFIEEVDEEPHAIDQLLTQLQDAGKFDEVAGIVFGASVNCEPKGTFRQNFCLQELLEMFFANLNIPVTYGLRFGHTDERITLPMGIETHLIVENDKLHLSFEEAACQ